jgi:hypothetical protein
MAKESRRGDAFGEQLPGSRQERRLRYGDDPATDGGAEVTRSECSSPPGSASSSARALRVEPHKRVTRQQHFATDMCTKRESGSVAPALPSAPPLLGQRCLVRKLRQKIDADPSQPKLLISESVSAIAWSATRSSIAERCTAITSPSPSPSHAPKHGSAHPKRQATRGACAERHFSLPFRLTAGNGTSP